jgi:hypothetical protein
MTHMSLQIRAYPEAMPREGLESGDLKSPVAMSLPHLARSCGPYKLADWAKLRGLEVFYVDNSWVRVPVSGTALPAFFSEVLGVEFDLEDTGLDLDSGFLIEAEEF